MNRTILNGTILALAAALPIGTSLATTYCWKGTTDGDWSDLSRWYLDNKYTTPATMVPGTNAEDEVWFPSGAYTVSCQNLPAAVTELKVSSATLQPATVAGRQVILDLGGRTLTSTRSGSSFSTLGNGSGPKPSQRDFAKPYTCFEFRNGTYNLSTYLQLINSPGKYPDSTSMEDRRGCFVFGQGAVFTMTFFEKFHNASRVFVQDGAKLTASTSFVMGNNIANWPIVSGYSVFCVTGETSSATLKGRVQVLTPGAGLYVLDGAAATISEFYLGTASYSTNSFVRVDDGTLKITRDCYFGADVEGSVGPALEIAGRGTLVDISHGQTSYGLFVCNGTGAHIDFEIPEDGFSNEKGSIPLYASTYKAISRSAGLTDEGATEMRVKARAWARKHPGESITLMSFSTKAATVNPNFETDLADLVAHATTDLRSTGDVSPVAKVGSTVVLTAPPRVGAAVVVR